MSPILVLGEPARVRPFRLAGALVAEAAGADAIRRAWESRPRDLAALVLTPAAAQVLERELRAERRLVWAVMP